jgi:hypothetical protein
MLRLIARSAALLLMLAGLLAACSRLGLGGKPQRPAQLPSPRQLKQIAYMSQTAGPDKRRIFDHFEQAKSCHDFEIAMRWNRPPNVRGGPFDQKLVYITARVPADLPKNSEVFVSGVIEAGRALSSGGSVWALKLKDGGQVQAVETAGYAAKQEEAQQNGGGATMIHPYTRGRALCAYGVYQGITGLALDQHGRVPLVSVLFAMDRRR